MKRHAREIGLYGLTTALLAIAALMVIPAMISVSGLDAWGAVATGQAVGVVGATVINYGWPLTGPTIVASGSDDERVAEVRLSAMVRATISPVCACAGVATAAALVPDFRFYAVCGAMMSLPLGLGFSWYFVGMRQPGRLLLLDTLPRLFASTLAVVLMASGILNAALGALVVGAGTLGGALLSLVALRTKPSEKPPAWFGELRAALRTRSTGLGSALANNGVATLPIVLLNLTSPQSVGVFAIVERPFRQMLSGMGVVVNVAQGQLANVRGRGAVGRIRRASLAAFALTPVSAALLAPLSWLLLRVLSPGEFLPWWAPIAVAALTAVHFTENLLSRAALPPLGQLAFLTRSTLGTGVVTLVIFCPVSAVWGATGAIMTVLAAAAARVGLQLARVLTVTRPSPSASRHLGP